MSLTQFIQGFGCQLQEFIWRDVANQGVQEEVERLRRRIHAVAATLPPQEALVERLQDQVSAQEERADWLASRVELYLHVSDRPKAWQHALELDQVRARLNRHRKQLQEQLRAYHDHQARLDDLRQQLAELQEEASFRS